VKIVGRFPFCNYYNLCLIPYIKEFGNPESPTIFKDYWIKRNYEEVFI